MSERRRCRAKGPDHSPTADSPYATPDVRRDRAAVAVCVPQAASAEGGAAEPFRPRRGRRQDGNDESRRRMRRAIRREAGRSPQRSGRRHARRRGLPPRPNSLPLRNRRQRNLPQHSVHSSPSSPSHITCTPHQRLIRQHRKCQRLLGVRRHAQVVDGPHPPW